ncbi:hypothetical protein JL721_2267 [Aureococcus anophagefferens]|nr:hypothetical protein JL721_2267 [Aureococcus anophagefferens]
MSSRPIKGIHSINVDRGFGPDGRRVKSPSDGLSLQARAPRPTRGPRRATTRARLPPRDTHLARKTPTTNPLGRAAGAGGRERKSPSPYSSSSRKSPSAGLGGDEKKKALGARERKERDRAAAAAAAASAAIVEEELKHDDDDDDEPESDVDDVELQSITAGLNQGALGPRPQNGASHVPSRLPSHLAGDEKKEAAEKKAPKDKTDPPRPRSAPGSRGHGADAEPRPPDRSASVRDGSASRGSPRSAVHRRHVSDIRVDAAPAGPDGEPLSPSAPRRRRGDADRGSSDRKPPKEDHKAKEEIAPPPARDRAGSEPAPEETDASLRTSLQRVLAAEHGPARDDGISIREIEELQLLLDYKKHQLLAAQHGEAPGRDRGSSLEDLRVDNRSALSHLTEMSRRLSASVGAAAEAFSGGRAADEPDDEEPELEGLARDAYGLGAVYGGSVNSDSSLGATGSLGTTSTAAAPEQPKEPEKTAAKTFEPRDDRGVDVFTESILQSKRDEDEALAKSRSPPEGDDAAEPEEKAGKPAGPPPRPSRAPVPEVSFGLGVVGSTREGRPADGAPTLNFSVLDDLEERTGVQAVVVGHAPAAFAESFRSPFHRLVDFGPDVDPDREDEINDRSRQRKRDWLRDGGDRATHSVRSALSSPETVISSVSDYTAWSCASPRSPNHVEFSYRPPPSSVPRIRLEALRSPRRGVVDDYILSPDPAKSISTLYSPRSAFTPRSSASNDDLRSAGNAPAAKHTTNHTARPGE